ncbi:rhomboid family intramembrane serine protease [Xanthovirga aplysinae]|uniref:rhomboid family intramembrane serine protease n=1 Tax=Xanthovirga aplysinae TaxID=2529853 RepID=UPI0012BC9A38|nr:rhomboid family intramembrane serine protease [Xanthovirga aplysinae]MTI30850.1 rhomboid family intramembrane serine protease [Xanthovirga aplysinae]
MEKDISRFLRSLSFAITFIALLWMVQGIEHWSTSNLGRFGNLPRTLNGAVGIITGPLIHGDFSHLLSNTFPLLLLIGGLFYFYPRIAFEVFFWIYVMSGFWVWMSAREAYHIGASGLIYGLISFLLFNGLFRKDSISITISLVIVFLYGSMLYGLFPSGGKVSWESHFFGALAGLILAFYFRRDNIKEGPLEISPKPEKESDEIIEKINTVDCSVKGMDYKYVLMGGKIKKKKKGNVDSKEG